MKKFVYTLLFMLLVFVAEAATLAGDIKIKRCETCGQIVSLCRYNGNHPKCQTCGKIVDNCPYKGNHPKCQTCGKTVDKCRYNGNHPKCKTCGKLVEQCPYKGNHPKCKTCGKLVDQCRYNGSHPKCKTCGKTVDKCRYNGNHPKCQTCGKPVDQCRYKGKHVPKVTPVGHNVMINCNAGNNANLYIDDKFMGPANRSYMLSNGRHKIKLEAKGYQSLTDYINYNVDEGKTSFNFDMKQLEFDVKFACNATDATFLIDDSIKVNPRDNSIKLNSGNHKVQIVSSSHNDSIARIDVDKDHVTFGFDLKKKRETQLTASSEGEENKIQTNVQGQTGNKQSTSPSKMHESVDPWFSSSRNWDGLGNSISLEYAYSRHFHKGVLIRFVLPQEHINYGFEVGIASTDRMELSLKGGGHEDVHPLWYATFVPGYCYRYFSVQCGLGIMNYNKDSNEEKVKAFFCMKPSVSGYIPITKKFSIPISVGYLFVPHFKGISGVSFNVGIMWAAFDD